MRGGLLRDVAGDVAEAEAALALAGLHPAITHSRGARGARVSVALVKHEVEAEGVEAAQLRALAGGLRQQRGHVIGGFGVARLLVPGWRIKLKL